MLTWQADKVIFDLVESIKNKHHTQLQEATIAVAFNDSKPFPQGRFNWGKTQKFNKAIKIFLSKQYDFLLSIPMDGWDILDNFQKEAWLDLRLSCAQVEYEPVTQEINGVKKPVKDEWGRIQYTTDIKRDDDGYPKWKVLPLDLSVFQDNVARYGCWCADLLNFRSALMKLDKGEMKHGD